MAGGPPAGDITELLVRWNAGEEGAESVLLPAVYSELQKLARRYLRHERPDHTLQATALVHEAYLKLIDQNRVVYKNRLHFYGLAASMMRRILVEHARSRSALKRGGSVRQISLEEVAEVSGQGSDDLVAVDEALSALHEENPELARIVELRFFGGFENREVADLLEISIPTIVRKWRVAKAWLYRYMTEGPALEH